MAERIGEGKLRKRRLKSIECPEEGNEGMDIQTF